MQNKIFDHNLFQMHIPWLALSEHFKVTKIEELEKFESHAKWRAAFNMYKKNVNV